MFKTTYFVRAVSLIIFSVSLLFLSLSLFLCNYWLLVYSLISSVFLINKNKSSGTDNLFIEVIFNSINIFIFIHVIVLLKKKLKVYSEHQYNCI